MRSETGPRAAQPGGEQGERKPVEQSRAEFTPPSERKIPSKNKVGNRPYEEPVSARTCPMVSSAER